MVEDPSGRMRPRQVLDVDVDDREGDVAPLDAAFNSASVSAPVSRRAAARAHSGVASPPSTSAMAPSRGVSLSTEAGTTIPIPAVCSRERVLNCVLSDGTSDRTIESDDATSLNGMPTAVFMPKLNVEALLVLQVTRRDGGQHRAISV